MNEYLNRIQDILNDIVDDDSLDLDDKGVLLDSINEALESALQELGL